MITLGRSSRQGDVPGTVPRSRKQINPRLPFLQLKRTILVAVSNASNAIHLRDNSPSQSSRFLWQQQASKDIEKAIQHFLYVTILTFREGVQAVCTCICIIIRIFTWICICIWNWLVEWNLADRREPSLASKAGTAIPPTVTISRTDHTHLCLYF